MPNGMTRREREITDIHEICRILDAAKVTNVGLVDDGEPYVVPMNYGYTMEDGQLTVYLHGAMRGRKLDVIAKEPRVFLTMIADAVPFEGDVACRYGMAYCSVMAKGVAEIVTDSEEKKRGLSVLMKTQTGKDFTFEDRLVSIVTAICIDVEEYTAKHRPLPEKLR